MERYQQIYLDRCLYWSLRWASSSGEGLLVVTLDRLDQMQVRCAWPWAPGRLSNDDGILVRPRLVVTAAAHGLTGAWGDLALAGGGSLQ